jgi:hypothetical protein
MVVRGENMATVEKGREREAGNKARPHKLGEK